MTLPCFIDGCPNAATLVLHTYPDDTRLCADHRHFLSDDPLTEAAEPCTGDGCDLCAEV